jgi:DNA-binding response OmpR family regulator
MSYRILIVEDDVTLQETLEYNLLNQGYLVSKVDDGYEALRAARAEQPDLILLDLMLPGIDGFEVCRILRRELSVPILMLTARTEEVDKIIGLEVGADDYLTKPFSMRELVARVKALLRRVELVREDMATGQEENGTAGTVVAQPATLTFGNLAIDEARREVRLDDQPVRMKPKEFDLLLYLARHRGIALSRDLILERVWGWSFDGNSRTVDVHIRWIREKIEPDPASATRILTVRGLGYRFDG